MNVDVSTAPVSVAPNPGSVVSNAVYTRNIDPLYDIGYVQMSTQSLIKMYHSVGPIEQQKIASELTFRRGQGEQVIQLPPPPGQ